MQVNQLKVAEIDSARKIAIKVTDSVSLVPVGSWILQEPELIEQMASWRQENMAMFCAKFKSTPAKTRDYLTNASIAQQNRILFLIFENHRMVGHLGLSNISGSTAELDNVMRGVRAETSSLMFLCISRLCDWASGELSLKQLTLRVVDVNSKALDLYARCGFETQSSSALKATQQADVTQYIDCPDAEATTAVRALLMLKKF